MAQPEHWADTVRRTIFMPDVLLPCQLMFNVGRGKKTHKTELSTKASPFRSAVKKENFQTMEKIRSDFRGLE